MIQGLPIAIIRDVVKSRTDATVTVYIEPLAVETLRILDVAETILALRGAIIALESGDSFGAESCAAEALARIAIHKHGR